MPDVSMAHEVVLSGKERLVSVAHAEHHEGTLPLGASTHDRSGLRGCDRERIERGTCAPGYGVREVGTLFHGEGGQDGIG